MTPYIDDPSDRGSLVDRTVAYVRGSIVLRTLLAATAFNHVAAILMVVADRLAGEMAGLLALLSVLAWFFAVLLPVMNREVRIRLGRAGASYWGEVVEMFATVLLCAQTLLYTAILVYAVALT